MEEYPIHRKVYGSIMQNSYGICYPPVKNSMTKRCIWVCEETFTSIWSDFALNQKEKRGFRMRPNPYYYMWKFNALKMVFLEVFGKKFLKLEDKSQNLAQFRYATEKG